MKKKPSMNQQRFDAMKALLGAGVNVRTISKVMTSSAQTVKFVDQAKDLDEYKQLQHDFYVVQPSRVKNYPNDYTPNHEPLTDDKLTRRLEAKVEHLQVTLDQAVALLQIMIQIMTEVKESKKRFF